VIIIILDSSIPGGALKPMLADMVTQLDLQHTLLNGVLCILLFASALEADFNLLKKQQVAIITLATVGILISTVVVGALMYQGLLYVGISVPFMYCLAFGALISPTDPIAVLGLLKTVTVPDDLKAKIAGESLFNDGAAVVAFTIILALATGTGDAHTPMDIPGMIKLFIADAVGGVFVGAITGYIAYESIKNVKDFSIKLSVTLALAAVTYVLAQVLHLSAPIAVVVAGILVGHRGRVDSIENESNHAAENVSLFWEGLDSIFNSALFLIVGFYVLILAFNNTTLAVGGIAIVSALFARWISVALPMQLVSLKVAVSDGAVSILTWGGLRGGISVALALSLPPNEYKPLILTATYAVVIFTIIIQGLTMKKLVLRYYPVVDSDDTQTQNAEG
jgi:CPA1 family monovalent cation:H+ antiporter